MNPHQNEVEDEVEPSYYEPPPQRIFQAQQQVEFLDKVSKETIILTFVAFFVGLLLGKSLTPVILKN